MSYCCWFVHIKILMLISHILDYFWDFLPMNFSKIFKVIWWSLTVDNLQELLFIYRQLNILLFLLIIYYYEVNEQWIMNPGYLEKNALPKKLNVLTACGADPSHKSHIALVRYPTMHHVVTEMCTFLLQNCALSQGYGICALWDVGRVHCGIYTTGLI